MVFYEYDIIEIRHSTPITEAIARHALLRFSIAGALALVTFLHISAVKAEKTQEEDTGVIQVLMRIATCTELPPEYLEDAILHGNCSSGDSEAIAGDADHGNGFEPAGTVPGNCGTSTLWAWNNGGGYAGFYLAAASTRGTIM
ncbi:MAG: hypothetical protein C4346_05010 [Chloroflexota bacterium]